MDQLFERSHNFRALLIHSRIEFQKFLELILGVALCAPEDEDPVHADRTDAAGRKRKKTHSKKSEKQKKQGLPPPKVAAKKLTELSLGTLKRWQDKFGSGYPLLRSAYEYLVKDGLIDIPGRRILNPEEVAVNNKRKQFAVEQLKARMQRICAEYDDFKDNDVNPIIDQINSGIELLIPRDYLVETTVTSKSLTSTIKSTNHYAEKQEHALNNNNEISLTFGPNSMSVKKTDDTEDIIRCVKEQAKILVRSTLPKLKKLMSRMSEGTEHSQAKLKSAIDLKVFILKTLSKLSQLGILIDDDKCQPGQKAKSAKVKKKKWVDEDGKERDDVNSDDNDEDDEDEEEEFIEVPEKPGLQSVIAQHERHLYGLETNTLSKDKDDICKLSKFEGRSCRAPLPSGKLCPRQDAIKCPFHGLIIDRDSSGEPVNETDRLREEAERANRVPEWQDPQYLRELEAQLGIDLTVGKRKRLKIASLAQLKNEKNSRQRIMEKIFN